MTSSVIYTVIKILSLTCNWSIVESGGNVCVWLVGVVSRRWVWLVGVGGIYGCGCKEVYIYRDFLILLIPTPLVYICSFLQQHPYFLFI